MANLSFFIFLAFLVHLSLAAQRPRGLAWSSKTYGPDGPWHAITVQIGSPAQSIDLFPGGFWQSNILSSSICSGTSSTCLASLAGLYNVSASSTSTMLSSAVGGSVDNGGFQDKGILNLVGSADIVFDSMSIVTEDPPSADIKYSNFDMLVISEGNEILPDGRKYAIEVGNLALGAPEINQTWGGINGSLVPSHQFLKNQVPSNSFGMHIGSTARAIPPSLYIGGYDQTKVLGEVTVQKYDMHYFPIDLLDVGIGVAEGESPFSFASKSGLLASGNSSVGVAMQVIVDPIAPFLYLPKSSCDAIAANLPVKYQPNLGLYFWDTTSTAYEQIISSPAFLSFTFRQNSSVTRNMTINVPFSLLNLTLSPPLVTTSTPYFPCSPFDYGKSYGGYTLGKAFLQAAFLGVNWQLDGQGSWFLSQAPGPNTPSEAAVRTIGLNDLFITPSTNAWTDTWKGSWTPIKASTTPGSDTNQTSSLDSKPSSGIPTATVVGITVPIVAVILFLAVGFWYWRRRKISTASVEAQAQETKPVGDYYEPSPVEMALNPGKSWELADHSKTGGSWEMESPKTRTELPG